MLENFAHPLSGHSGWEVHSCYLKLFPAYFKEPPIFTLACCDKFAHTKAWCCTEKETNFGDLFILCAGKLSCSVVVKYSVHM